MSIDPRKLRDTVAAIKEKFHTDPEFKASFKSKPMATLKDEGFTIEDLAKIEQDDICIVTRCNVASII